MALQPLEFVTKTDIGPGTEITLVLVVIPFDQRKVLPAPDTTAVSVVDADGHIPGVPEIEITGKSFTVTTTGDDVVVPQPVPSSNVTV